VFFKDNNDNKNNIFGLTTDVGYNIFFSKTFVVSKKMFIFAIKNEA